MGMCGIFATTNDKNSAQTILSGLKKLEYRGYDSWGIAVKGRTRLRSQKQVGKISVSQTTLPQSNMGIGHTRWATHGGVTVANAHPHFDCSGKLALIHNGIVDNYQELEKKIKGHKLIGQTDSEIIVHLIEKELKTEKDLFRAVKKVVRMTEGFNAFVVMHQDFPYLVTAKTGSPVVIGIRPGANMLSSDVASLLSHTKQVIFLTDGQIAKVAPDKVRIENYSGVKEIKPVVQTIDWTAKSASKSGFPHFMLKEIYDQPAVLIKILESKIKEVREFAKTISKAKNVFTVACGTASYAALAGQYLFSRLAGRQVTPAIGSEFYYNDGFINSGSLCIALSQSGETLDTLQSVKFAKDRGAKAVSLVNVQGSSLDRLSDQTVLLEAGPEKAVASTKSFTAKVAILLLTAKLLAGKLPDGKQELTHAAQAIKAVLAPDYGAKIRRLAVDLKDREHIFVVGRGQSYPAALEAALKIKEVSYIHAEGLAGGELKHGPIALISEDTPTIAICPQDDLYDKTLSNIQEIKARSGKIIAIATEGDTKISQIADDIIYIPKTDLLFYPLLIALPLQLLAYHIADIKECDIDKPRNLAKSVTVE